MNFARPGRGFTSHLCDWPERRACVPSSECWYGRFGFLAEQTRCTALGPVVPTCSCTACDREAPSASTMKLSNLRVAAVWPEGVLHVWMQRWQIHEKWLGK
jgi:hypothetical protein